MSQEADNSDIGFSGRLLGFLLLGIALVFVGIVVLVLASVVLSRSGSIGGIILIGPIPIVFGAGPYSTILIIISAVLAALSFALFILMSRRTRKEE